MFVLRISAMNRCGNLDPLTFILSCLILLVQAQITRSIYQQWVQDMPDDVGPEMHPHSGDEANPQKSFAGD